MNTSKHQNILTVFFTLSAFLLSVVFAAPASSLDTVSGVNQLASSMQMELMMQTEGSHDCPEHLHLNESAAQECCGAEISSPDCCNLGSSWLYSIASAQLPHYIQQSRLALIIDVPASPPPPLIHSLFRPPIYL